MPRFENEPTILEAIDLQAAASDVLGSRFNRLLLDAIREDYLTGGIAHELLDAAVGRPVHDALPLRLLSGLHRLALTGREPTLVAQYPSCGGTPTDSLANEVVDAMNANRDYLAGALTQNVQTNEVGRSRALVAGLSWLRRRYGFEQVQLFELGASAGLNLCVSKFWYKNATGSTGPIDSPLRFDDGWGSPVAPISPAAEVVDIHGCDVAPINIRDEEGRTRLLSFVWPDQHERFARLRAAIEVAAGTEYKIDPEDAGPWLERRLRSHATGVRVVWHSIAWQYFPQTTKDHVRDVLEREGAATTAETPLIWLRMEPAGATADLQATVWHGGKSENLVLARVGYHGADIEWLAG